MNVSLASVLADKRRLMASAALLVFALLSAFVLAPIFSSPDFYAGTIESLGNKETGALGLMAGATAASIGLSTIPSTENIGKSLADLSGYIVIILSAIVLEKYLLVIIPQAVFMVIFPAACVLFIINMFAVREAVFGFARKLTLLGIAALFVIPVSVAVSDFVSETYSDITAVSVAADDQDGEKAAADAAEGGSVADGQTQDFWSDPLAAIQDLADGAGAALEKAKESAENMLNQFIEGVVVFIVTTCVLPILILLFFLWLVKAIFEIDVPMPKRLPMEKNPLRKVSAAAASGRGEEERL
ncbi:MAG: hypothetical protein ACI37P_04155 [Eggerthellaceae bacterium]